MRRIRFVIHKIIICFPLINFLANSSCSTLNMRPEALLIPILGVLLCLYTILYFFDLKFKSHYQKTGKLTKNFSIDIINDLMLFIIHSPRSLWSGKYKIHHN